MVKKTDWVFSEMGRVTRAPELYKESLKLARRFGFAFDAVICLEGIARVEAARGRARPRLGRGGFAGLLLGSVSQNVAAHARCTVVVAR